MIDLSNERLRYLIGIRRDGEPPAPEADPDRLPQVATALAEALLRLRADAADAERGAAACDQVVALLDGFPVPHPCPEAARVAALLEEVERLRTNADARERVLNRVHDLLRAAERERDELRAEVSDLRNAYVDGEIEGGFKERAAVVTYLRNQATHMGQDHGDPTSSCWSEIFLHGTAVNIERGEHRKEETP